MPYYSIFSNFAPDMNTTAFRQRLKPWILPIAMVTGLLCHSYISYVSFMTQWLIFLMLFITFCRIRPAEIRMNPMMIWLLAVQVGGAMLLYALVNPLSHDVAQGVFICVFCPTATAAPVITAALGGHLPRVVAYSLLSNIAVAVLAAPLLSVVGDSQVAVAESMTAIAAKVFPLIIIPLIAALLLRRVAPKVHSAIATKQGISFYVWALAVIIAIGNSVEFILREPASKIPEIIVLALAAGAVCIAQFIIGRRIGGRYGDRISAAQGLGQKNTVLAIWFALTYLNPIVSVGPAAYIAWQNTINSVQLYLRQRRTNKP